MRQLLSFNMMSADGYFAGTNSDLSWHKVDEEVNDFIIEQLKTTDTLLFGRKTFEVMESFWPSEKAFETDPVTAQLMGGHLKIVFSKTRDHSGWKNTKWEKENMMDKVEQLKRQPGKNIFIFGSAHLCKTLIQNNLIDEFRLMINPVVLGEGKPFFYKKMDLQLLKTKVFGNGNTLLTYRRNN